MGGNAPNINHFSFLYTKTHPVLCDVGQYNVENRERINHRIGHFNKKKWKKFMKRKTSIKIIQFLKSRFPKFFQKKKKNKICVLNEDEGHHFSDQTHKLICQSTSLPLLEIIKNFYDLLSSHRVTYSILYDWIESVERAEDEEYMED